MNIDFKELIKETDQLVEKKEYELAKELLIEAAETGETLAYIKLGDLYKMQGYANVANKYFEKAYRNDPYNQELLNELKIRGFTSFDLDSLIQTKKINNQKSNKFNRLSNNKLMKKHWFSYELEACANTIWLVARLLALIIIISTIILLFTSVEQKLVIFIYSVIFSIMAVISGWIAKTLIIGFGVVVRNQEDQINLRNQKKEN